MTYCGPTFKPKLPSQTSNAPAGAGSKGISPNSSIGGGPSLLIHNMANTQKQKLAMRLREIASLALSITSGKKLNLSSLNKARQSYVIPGFGYALMDMFENKDVDMDTIAKKPKNDEVMSPFKSPTRAERRSKTKASPAMTRGDSILKKRKRRKKGSPSVKKSATEAGKNLNKAPPIQYKLIKIKTSVGNYPVLNVNPPFTNNEIKLAKKCILNEWTEPPNEDDDKSKASPNKAGDKDFKIEMSPVKENEENKGENEKQEDEGEGQEKEKPMIYEPRTRAPGGIWLQAGDFPFCFQYFIVFHNEEKIKNKLIHKDLWTDPQNTYKVNEDDIYIRVRDPTDEEIQEQQEQEEPAEDEHDKYKNIEKDLKKDNRKHVLVGFSPNPTLKYADKLPRYYCRLTSIDTSSVMNLRAEKESKEEDNNIVLSDFKEDEELQKEFLFSHYFSGQMLKLENIPKLILKPSIYAPLGYNMWLASESKIEIINRSQFFVEEEDLFSKSYQVEQFNVQKEKYTLLFKFDFNPTRADTECQFSLKTDDKYLYSFMRMKIIDKAGLEMDPEDDDKPLSLNQKLVESTSITTLNAVNTEKITFQPNKDKGYSLICETMAPYDVYFLNLDLDMITNREDLELERIEMVEPLLYTDLYIPYKYGIIFKEKIYVGASTSAAFNITLTKKNIIKKPIEKPEGEGADEAAEPKEPVEGEPAQPEEPQFEEIEEIIELKKNFKVEIFDSEELISTYYGNGHITISHFNFKSNEGLEDKPQPAAEGEAEQEDAPPAEPQEPPADGETPPEDQSDKEYKHYYVMQATFDKNDWPECTIKDTEETNEIKWEIRVFSSDTVAIVKDTDKEDRENALKESWETAEPGRAEKSHKSRLRYLAMIKQQNGEELTEEEQEIVSQKRIRGAANLREVAADPKAAKGKADKKGAPAEEDEKEEEVPIQYPSSTDYTNLFFKEFIHHFESDRLIHVKCEKSAARLRDEREIEERQKEREDEVASWENIFNNRLQNRETEMKDREEKQKKSMDILLKSRKDFIEKTEGLFEKRNQYRELISNRKFKEVLLMDILNAEKIEIPALEQALQEAKEALVKKETLEMADKKLEVLKYSKGVEEELQAASGEKNAEKMKELIDKIESENLIIEPKILNDAKNVLSKIK